MKAIKFLAAAALVAAPMGSFAQKGIEDGSKFGHGEDSVRCIMNLVLYGDHVKQQKFDDAYEPWRVVFNECPLAKGTNLYVDGVKIAKAKIKSDKANRATYIDLLMQVYDQRIKYFSDNKNYPASYLKGMKALDMLSLKPNDKGVRKEAVANLNEAINGTPSTIQPAFVQTYMLQTVNQFKDGEVPADDVVNAYLKCADVLPRIEAAAPEKTKAKTQELVSTTQEQVEQIFAQSGAADCQTIIKIFGPQLAANTGDADWLKKTNKLLSAGDCTESDLYYATSESLHKIAPEAGSARGLAKMYLKQSETDKALSYYDEAIKLETDDKLKAQYYYEKSAVLFANQNFAAAKAAAQQAANIRGQWGAPYLLLGKIYAAGAKNIGAKDYEKKAGYWAACDKFAKAKAIDSSESVQKEASDLIRQYSQYFPSKEDLFFEGIQDGTSYHVGGFINENTTVRAKK